MRASKPAAFILVVGAAGLAGYRAGWLHGPSSQNAELPWVEFREMHSGPSGDTGTFLTVDRTGLATLQTLPLGPGSKTTRLYLNCDEFADLPEQMRYEFGVLRSSYGTESGANQGEVSVVSRWNGSYKRVVWRNPESSPKPPEGAWAGLVGPLEDIRRRAEEASKAAELGNDVVVEYGHLSSGHVGSYITLLSIRKWGQVTLGHGLGVPWPVGVTQLPPAELATLLRTIEEAKFEDFHQCYGQHAPVNPQNTWMVYWHDGTAKEVTWMSDPADPRPPEGWFRIVAILNEIQARIKRRDGESSRPG